MNSSRATCVWPGKDPLMVAYHDVEWGVPIHDDKKIFEFLVLESAQAGLSWKTILHKREGYRKLFAQFEAEEVAQFTVSHVEKLLTDTSIIRNRLKILAAINNAARFLEVQREFGKFSKYMWGFVGGEIVDGKRHSAHDIPAITVEAEKCAQDLKKRGFKFLGPTVIYAHMQAVGMVNDHIMSCFRYTEVAGKK